ncbi:T9SS type A sorting domain-containing protein [Aquimarina litoralis]|uniref:T9SS type A sorting domain-containing protein n=1 Tax=Aquimarina litoralis TaxID=584605 RepID=UPI001C55B153|nr:T9SS type A sorting domain-containing protein [Aquimarina litoralis]
MKNYLLLLILILSVTFKIHAQKPSPDNTGTTGTLTEYTGATTITQDGTTLENYSINGTLNIRANNVTIKNCLIATSGIYGIRANYGHTGLLVENCEIKDMQSAAILGDNFTARNCNIWNSGGDGIKPGNNFLIEGCYFQKLGYKEDAHADGIQMVAGGNGIIRGNTFDMPYDVQGYRNSQCIIILTNNASIDNILIENNWIDGGGYSVQVRDKGNGHGIPTNVDIKNNLLGRNHQFGTHVLDEGVVWSCNRWEDTNELIGSCNSLSVNDESLQSVISIYPNPVSNELHIELSKNVNGQLNISSIEGKKVNSFQINNKKMFQIPTSDLANGLYILTFKNGRSSISRKILVQN